MSPTPHSEQMKAVVAYVAPLMKEWGFKKRRHCFNRTTADGLVHVLDFQMAPYEPTPPNLDRDVYIGSRNRTFNRIFGAFPAHYGTFTVNLGVFFPEVDEAQAAYFRPDVGGRAGFIHEYRCHIRKRLGDLSKGEDIWWALDVPVAELGLLMTEAFRRYASPFLDRFPNRKAVRALWEHHPDLVPFLGPARLYLAIMAAHEGDHARAQELIQAHYEETTRKGPPGHAEYVQGVAAHLGYALTSHSPGEEM